MISLAGITDPGYNISVVKADPCDLPRRTLGVGGFPNFSRNLTPNFRLYISNHNKARTQKFSLNKKSMTTLTTANSISAPSPRWRLVYPGIIFSCLLLALALQARATCQEGCDTFYKNTFLGDDALLNNSDGYYNVAVGAEALSANSEGIANVAIGWSALSQNTTGFNNTATGYQALTSNTIGGANTADGIYALLSNTSGVGNTAVGDGALTYNSVGSRNTAIGDETLTFNTASDNTALGHQALDFNTTGTRNVAIGSYALYSNKTGIDNTATGFNALYSNTANYNTAHGYKALEKNTSGSNNTATGLNALNKNTTGSSNAAHGASALYSNITGIDNTASGVDALYSNTGGYNNMADGYAALYKNTTGAINTALGSNALYSNSTGSNNIALGFQAGFNLTTGSLNIDIGNTGVAAEANTIRVGTAGSHTNTYIAGISGVTVAGGIGVIVDSNGHLGTTTSSARYKKEIRSMDKASEAILSLKPVTFRYKEELDPAGIPQFGLVAEEVARVNPDLVMRDSEGKPYTVRYEAVNAMLLNEFLKAHKKSEMQEGTIARQEKRIEALELALKEQSAQIQEVAAQLPSSQGSARVANN